MLIHARVVQFCTGMIRKASSEVPFTVPDVLPRLRLRPPGSEAEKVITTLRAGDYFGETSIITAQPRAATVKASSHHYGTGVVVATFAK